MLSLIFSLDYEIHGNGEGCPYRLMVEPTARLLKFFDQYGAKLTILADVGEILKFKSYHAETGRDDYHYQAIANQLCQAVRTGHDVQLHIHSSYFNARALNGRWEQDWSEYNFAGLSYDRMEWMIRSGKEFLEELLRPVRSDYQCTVFRAANWSVSPSQNVVRALLKNGLRIDTSVFKYGRRDGIVSFDYRSAHHPLLPWRADPVDLCRSNPAGALWEFPIYSEERWTGAFATPNRVYRALVARAHRISGLPVGQQTQRPKKASSWSWLFERHAWKADFNQCSGRQLIRSLIQAEKNVPSDDQAPFVLIGHSKLFNRWNERSLRPLLSFVRNQSSRFNFGTFGDFETMINSDEARREARHTHAVCQ